MTVEYCRCQSQDRQRSADLASIPDLGVNSFLAGQWSDNGDKQHISLNQAWKPLIHTEAKAEIKLGRGPTPNTDTIFIHEILFERYF